MNNNTNKTTREQREQQHETLLAPLKAAGDLITGARRQEYGDPYESLETASLLWNIYVTRKKRNPGKINVEDVPAMMGLLKVAREMNQAKGDNRVDQIAYGALKDYVESVLTAAKWEVQTPSKVKEEA